MDHPIIKVENLSVRLEGQEIIHDVSFEINPREVLAIIGPNGSGKTVLLKSLLGIIKPSGGEIDWMPNIRIGYLPQRFNVDKYLPMTVGEFLNLKSEKSYKLEDALKMVGFEKKALQKSLAYLSGGEMQKTLLAWAIMDDPQILLFDEPTENVDPISEESIYRLLHDLQARLGIAMIIVSHDLHVVYRYANNVLCLNKKAVCYGAPKETLTKESLVELYGEHAHFHHHHSEENRS